MFSSGYIEYFSIYASVLLSLKSNVAPSKKATVIYRNDIQNETTSAVLTQNGARYDNAAKPSSEKTAQQ